MTEPEVSGPSTRTTMLTILVSLDAFPAIVKEGQVLEYDGHRWTVIEIDLTRWQARIKYGTTEPEVFGPLMSPERERKLEQAKAALVSVTDLAKEPSYMPWTTRMAVQKLTIAVADLLDVVTDLARQDD